MSTAVDAWWAALGEAKAKGDIRKIAELSKNLPYHRPEGPTYRIEDVYQFDWRRVPQDMLMQCCSQVEQDCQSLGIAHCREFAEYFAITEITDRGPQTLALCSRHYARISPYVIGYQRRKAREIELLAGSGI